MNIENPTELMAYLRNTGRVDRHWVAQLSVSVLAGGVSNRTVLVKFPDGIAWVLKQALPKLRVTQDWFCDPQRIEREALALEWLAKIVPVGTIPALQFADVEHHLLAMSAVPEPHENWKTVLLQGEVDYGLVRDFGRWLGNLHAKTAPNPTGNRFAEIFADRTYFEALRLAPYYEAAAERSPAAREFFQYLIAETRSIRMGLVHGDYSPKNTLIHRGQIVLLDFEVIHFGDPAFDVGFSMTHFLSKAHHCAGQREAFRQAALIHWETYWQARGGPLLTDDSSETRAVRHTLACLLARVDGRSPLEYLSATERDRQRHVVVDLIRRPPSSMPELIEAFTHRLGELD